jgi:hypothetical protein
MAKGKEGSIEEEPSHVQTVEVESESSKGGDEAASFSGVVWRTVADTVPFYRSFF